jgi:hypothetical protein
VNLRDDVNITISNTVAGRMKKRGAVVAVMISSYQTHDSFSSLQTIGTVNCAVVQICWLKATRRKRTAKRALMCFIVLS